MPSQSPVMISYRYAGDRLHVGRSLVSADPVLEGLEAGTAAGESACLNAAHIRSCGVVEVA